MSHYEAPIREPLIIGDKSYHDISNDIAAPTPALPVTRPGQIVENRV